MVHKRHSLQLVSSLVGYEEECKGNTFEVVIQTGRLCSQLFKADIAACEGVMQSQISDVPVVTTMYVV